MRRAVMLTVIVVASIVAACGDGGEAETTPTPAAQPTATAEASLTATPSPEPMGTPTPRPLTLEDAAQYFDITAVLPSDFMQGDPVAAGYDDPGPGYSDHVLYESSVRREAVLIYMELASDDTEKEGWRLLLREPFFEGLIRMPFEDDEMEVDVELQDVDVGDMANMAGCIVNEDGGELYHTDVLVFLQDEGPQAAVVWIRSYHMPLEAPTVDMVTVAKEISNNIANR